MAIVVVQMALRLRHARVVPVMQVQLRCRIIARVLHRLRERNEGAGADVRRDAVRTCGHGLQDAAVVRLVRIEVEPHAAFAREEDFLARGARFRDGRDEEVRAPQVRGRDARRRHEFIVRVLEQDGAHHRHARAAIVEGGRVVIGQHRVAQADGGARQRLHGRGAEDRLGRHLFLRVRTEDRLEHAVLQPAHVQLVVQHGPGKAAQVGMHVRLALHAHLQRDFHLRLEAAPAPLHVARPRDHAEALRSRVTRAHQDERPFLRIVARIAVGDQFRPFVAVDVVDLVRRAGGMARGGRMRFRFAQIAPPAGDAARLEVLVDIPEPVARLRLEHVDEARVPEEEIEDERLALRIRREDALLRGVLPALRRRQHERFRDEDGLDALPAEIRHHRFRAGEAVAVPREVAHRALDGLAEPVQVEHDGIQRDAVRDEFFHDGARLAFRVVAEAAREIAERPARRQRLAARQAGRFVHQLRPVVTRDHLVRLAAAHHFVAQGAVLAAVEIEPAGPRIVEVDRVLVRRHGHRDAIAHLVRAVAEPVRRPVVQAEAVAAPVHADGARPGAVQRLVALEREFDAFQFPRMAVALLLGDERPALVGVADAQRRFVHRDRDAVRDELDAPVRFPDRRLRLAGLQHDGVRGRIERLAARHEARLDDVRV
ncbi:conserved hypothetical protein, partial [Ricinus communis]